MFSQLVQGIHNLLVNFIQQVPTASDYIEGLLESAIRKDAVPVVSLALALGANPDNLSHNSRGNDAYRSGLELAFICGSYRVMQYLIAAGAQYNASEPPIVQDARRHVELNVLEKAVGHDNFDYFCRDPDKPAISCALTMLVNGRPDLTSHQNLQLRQKALEAAWKLVTHLQTKPIRLELCIGHESVPPQEALLITGRKYRGLNRRHLYSVVSWAELGC